MNAIDQATMLTALAGTGVDRSVNPTVFRRTDAGNADLFIAMFSVDLRYVEEWQRWMVWDGTRWTEASDLMLTPFAKRATEHVFEWANTLPEDDKIAWRRHAMQSQRRERLRAMIDLAKGHPEVRAAPSLFDSDPMLLGCEGMTFDLLNLRPRPPGREDYITKTTGITPLKNGACPEWLALLDWAFDGDADTIEHLQRVAGYILTGRVSEEKLFAFFGGGANGKSTVAMTLFDMLGDYAGRARCTLLMDAQGAQGAASPDVAALRGLRLVIVSETDDQCSLAEAQVKSITSNEPIAARKLHRDPFTYMPSHKVILMTNHRPFIKGTDDGIWRRLDIIGFYRQIDAASRIDNFRETMLRPELPAILAWAIKGCFKWQRDGLKPSAAVRDAKAIYRRDMDYIAQWLEERTEIDPKARVSRTAVYNNFKAWAGAEEVPVLGNRRFGEELTSRGYTTTRTHGARVVNGLRMKEQRSAPYLVQGDAAGA